MQPTTAVHDAPSPTLGQLIAAVPQALVTTDLDGRITLWAGAAERLYGWSEAEAVGRVAAELLVPGPDRRRAVHLRDEALRHRPFTGHLTLCRKDGSTFPGHVMNAPVHDAEGRVVGLLGIARDITEELIAAHDLAGREARYRAIVDTSLEGIWMFDPEGRTSFANRRMAELLALDEDALSSSTVFDFVRPAGHDGVRRVLGELRAGASARFDTVLVRPSGGEVPVDLVVAPLRDDAGRHLGGLAMVSDATERRAVLAALRDQEERLTHVLEAGGLAAWEIDLATGRYEVADNLSAVFGTRPDLPPEQTFEEFMGRVHPDDLDLFLAAFSGRMGPGDPEDFAVEYRITKHGAPAWIRTQGRFVRDGAGRATAVRGMSSDVTAQRAESARRAEVAEVYRRTVEASSDAFVGADPDGLITDWNPAATEMFGWAAEEVIGRHPVDELFPVADRAVYRAHLAGLLSEHRAPGREPLPARMEITARHRSGRELPVELSIATVRQGGHTEVRAFVRDITERRAHERELTERALHDHLTGLPNRTLLADRLSTAIAGIGRRGRGIAVLFLDVDRFKVVNDSLGHRAGDLLLVGLAERLRASVRPDDTVARLGGDEFVVLCQDLAHPAEAVEVAERVFDVLEEPFALGSRSHRVDVSVGIAHASGPGDRAEDLLRDADVAMYQAKSTGGRRIAVFDASLRERARRRLDLEDELRTALDDGGIVAYYQPVHDVVGGHIVGFEALARWHHPVQGVIEPAHFIAVAEETGLITALGEQVLDQACARLARWRAHPAGAGVRVAVNLSGRQLSEPGAAALVERTLERHGLSGTALCLEITESTLMVDSVAAAATLRALDDLGVELAVDDFGTGYSSLLYLRNFPVGVLKLDRAFVSGLGTNPADEVIVGSMIDLAHSLGMTAVAEGVETAGQRAALARLGCDHAQGYLWSAPVAAPAADRLVGLRSGSA